jgi:hypothetical protein
MSTLVPHTWTNSNGKLSPTGIVKGGGSVKPKVASRASISLMGSS